MDTPKFKRVLLKISGEALAGDKKIGLDFDVVDSVAKAIKECVALGVQIGVVVGGGNFWRGVKDGGGRMERTRADHMGNAGHGHQRIGAGRRAGKQRCRCARADRH